jgi:hypothetical protein
MLAVKPARRDAAMLLSLRMDKAEFRTVFAGVRPARIAVLFDERDTYWQETCLRIIECLFLVGRRA